MGEPHRPPTTSTSPHEFEPRYRWWQFWRPEICHHCYLARRYHPTLVWVKARSLHDMEHALGHPTSSHR